MWQTLLEALIDSAKALPFLLVIYLLIEFLESNDRAKNKTVKLLNGKLAPLVAGGVGLIPQCGFSVMATDLYLQKYLKTGTLIAFFVATSDEALPILLTNSQTVGVVWKVVLVKVVYAVILGYVVNLFDKRPLAVDYALHDEGCCGHEMHHTRGFWQFVKHPLLHTLKLFVYIFVVNGIFGLLMFYAESDIVAFCGQLGVWQCFVTALVGLVPNCASSVVLTGMFTEQIITFSALVAGLVSNSGIALAILLKDKNNVKRNLVVLAILYFAGVLVGVVCHLISFLA